MGFLELGNPTLPVITADTTISNLDTVVCFQESVALHATPGYTTYEWSTGTNTEYETVNQDGLYWAIGKNGCALRIDTFHVTFTRFSSDLGPDTFICPGKTVLLDAQVSDAAYQWQDGSTASLYTVNQAGTYSLAVTSNGCTAYDTIIVADIIPKLDILEPDTVICTGSLLNLHAMAVPASQLIWSNGNTGDHIVITETGTYSVTATNVCGTLTDEVTVSILDCNCITPFIPNAFSPNGDDKNEMLKVRINCPGLHDFYFAVYNRYGQRVFESRNIDEGWNGLHNGHKADIGTYFYRLQYKTGEGREIKKKGDVTLLH